MPTKKTLDEYIAELRRVEESRQANSEKNIQKLYKEIIKDLNSFLANEYADFSDNDGKLSVALLQEKARYANFLQEVDSHLNGITPEISKEIKDVVKNTYKATYEGMIEAVSNSVDSEELRERLKGLSLTPEVMNRAVNNPISGLTLPDTLEKYRKEVIYNIKQQINIGLMTGATYTTMARNVKKVISGDNGTGGSYAKAMNIVRTETHRVQESGFNDCAKEISEGLKGSELIYAATWHNMGDERVRPNVRRRTKKGWKTYKSHTTANHEKLEGLTIKVGDKFEIENGVFTECPGMSGTARNDCNCRCFLEYSLMTAEEFAKATGKSIDEIENVLLEEERQVLQENIDNAEKEIEDLKNDFITETLVLSYDDFLQYYNGDYNAVSYDATMEKKLKHIGDKIKKLETQKSEWETTLNEKMIAKQKKALFKQQADLQDEIDNFNIKTYSGIWKNDVTTADWKNLNIDGKKQYYKAKLLTETDTDLINKYNDLYAQLLELDNEGKKYNELQKELNKVTRDIANVGKDKNAIFSADAYGKRKDEAIKNRFTDDVAADAYYRPQLDRDFLNMPDVQKYSAWEYTHNSNPINKPLSGYTDNWDRADFKGYGNVKWSRENQWRSIHNNFKQFGANGHVTYEEVVKNLTNTIEHTTFDKDVLTVRGSGDSGLAGLVESGGLDFNTVMSKLANNDITWLKGNLEDKVFQNHAFTSTAMVNVPSGFTNNIYYEVYMPKGTKAIYTEPQSYYGGTINGAELYTGQKANYIGNESEIVIQRGTKFKITDIEMKSDPHSGYSNKYTVKMEVVEQPDYFNTGYEHTFDNGLTSEK